VKANGSDSGDSSTRATVLEIMSIGLITFYKREWYSQEIQHEC
jgi:hypothetical protein